MNTNRLLDMLKSATSPPATFQESTSSLPPGPAAQSGGSPREPSPSPPPPALQTVSLQELFAAMSSPPPAAPKQTPPPSSASDQKAKLLGMLNSITPPVGSDSPKASVDAGETGSDRRSSGSHTRPLPKSPVTSSQTPPGSSNLKSPPTTLAEPVINHSSSSPSHDSRPSLPAASGTASPFGGDVPPPVTSPTSNPFKSPVEANPTPPKKSMFDFVSPFSAFDNPKPPPNAEKKSEPTPQSSIINGGSSQQSNVSSPAVAAPKAPTTLVAAQETRARQTSNVSSSGTLSGSRSNKDLGLPYLLKQIVEKGTQGRGPKQMAKQGVTFDLSQPHLDSLVNTPGAVQIIPTTILRTDNVAFNKGRSVGITSNWLAYALTKGRVRLIHSASGARLVLQLPPRSTQGFIVDIAVSGDLVAIVGPDHSVTVFRVPEEWTKDDPPVEMLGHVTPSRDEEDMDADLGEITQVEWVEKVKGEKQLAIGGPGGVVIVNMEAIKGRDEISTADLARENKVLATDGPSVNFCLNASHQAIGLISTNGTFTLYNLANLTRVWNRKLHSNLSDRPPSSIQFCESNLLVGRANNTTFELVQITVEQAVLATFSFTVPPPPTGGHFCQAVYDHSRSMLWIAPFARGSLLGFKYNLKGIPPGKVPDLPAAFDKYAEYPLEPVLSLVLGPDSREGNAELFFATPTGFSQVQVDKAACDALTSEAAQTKIAPPPQTKTAGLAEVRKSTKVNAGTKTPSKQAQSPVVKSEPLWEATKDKQQETVKKEREIPVEPARVESALSDEVSKALKRTESTLQNNFKQLLANQLAPMSTRLDSMASGDLAEEIGAKVEKQIKSSITSIVQQEIKRSVLPAINSTIQAELRSATATAIPIAVSSALQTMPRDLERSLAPVFQRIVSNVVQVSVDRAVQDALTTSLLPSMTAASARLAEQLKSDFKSEMVQIRKDFSPPRSDPQPSHEPLLRSLAASIAEMQQQIASLSAARAQAPEQHPGPVIPPAPGFSNLGAGVGMPPASGAQLPGAQAPHFPPPPMAQAQQPIPQLQQSAAQLEDAFLAALGAQSSGATVQLVNEYWPRTEGILPSPPGRSPLSQAVLLTLFHRVAVALGELSPYDTSFNRLANWLRRIAQLLEPRNPETASFYPRVLPVVQGIINNTITMLQSRYPGDVENVRLLRSVLDIVNK